MANVPDGVTKEVESTTDSQDQATQEVETSAEGTETVSEGSETTQEVTTEKPGEATSPQDEVFTIEDIERDDDGNFILRADPDDPNTTIYKGKNPKELFQNVRKGIKDKDGYIGKLKAEKLTADSAKGKKPEVNSQAEEVNSNIDYGQILTEVAAQAKIDPSLLAYSDDQWRELELEKGSIFANRLYNQVQQVAQLANKRYDEANVDFINNRTLDEENEQVVEIVAEMGLENEFSEEDYKAVLDSVYSDKKNFNRAGIRKNGVIIKEVVKKLRAIDSKKVKEVLGKQTNEEIAKGRLKKTIVTATSPTKGKPGITKKAPTSIEEASKQILDEWGQ